MCFRFSYIAVQGCYIAYFFYSFQFAVLLFGKSRKFLMKPLNVELALCKTC